MPDSVTPNKRSEIMARVRAKDTRPELFLRKLLHKAGFRYRLHVANLPGKPDLVFPSRKKLIFVHGCFWHMHQRCARARTPKSRVDFWVAKLNGNRDRDVRNLEELQRAGWDVLVVWECELSNPDLLIELISFLNKPTVAAKKHAGALPSAALPLI